MLDDYGNRYVYTSSTIYLLDLVAGADSFTPGGGNLISFLNGGRPIIVVDVTGNDAAAVVGPH